MTAIHGRVKIRTAECTKRRPHEPWTIGSAETRLAIREEQQLLNVIIMNPSDSQGNQVCDYRGGVYPTLRGCGGAGYQQGYIFAPKTMDGGKDDGRE